MAYITFMVWHCFKTRKHTLVIRFFSFTLIPFSFIFSLSFSIRIRVLHFHFSFRYCVKVCVPHTILFSILSRRSFPLRRIKQLKKFWLFFRFFFLDVCLPNKTVNLSYLKLTTDLHTFFLVPKKILPTFFFIWKRRRMKTRFFKEKIASIEEGT